MRQIYVDRSVAPTLMPAIERFVTRLGAATADQISMFFRIHHRDTIQWCLQRLLNNPRINYSEEKKTYYPRTPTLRKADEEESMRQAAWILASMGDVNVSDYLAMRYPQSLLIITTDNEVYDVTVLNSLNYKAKVGTFNIYKRENSPVQCDKNDIPKEMPDIVNHIALVSTPELGEQLVGSPFDSYCILNSQTHEPKYKAL